MLRWIFPALLSGLIATMAFFPMSWVAGWVLPDSVKSAAPDLTIRGTVWQGSVTGLPIFGTANLDVAPLSRTVAFQSGQDRNYASGTVTPTAAKDLDLRLDLASIPFTDGRLQGLQGEFTAEISEAQYEKQLCQSAVGIAHTDVLKRNGGKIDWTGPELTGPIRCEDGALIVDLSGRDAQQSIAALIRLMPSGSYRADITVQTNRAEADAILPLFGFSRSGQSFKLIEQGSWR
jgi:hypothetical protein